MQLATRRRRSYVKCAASTRVLTHFIDYYILLWLNSWPKGIVASSFNCLILNFCHFWPDFWQLIPTPWLQVGFPLMTLTSLDSQLFENRSNFTHGPLSFVFPDQRRLICLRLCGESKRAKKRRFNGRLPHQNQVNPTIIISLVVLPLVSSFVFSWIWRLWWSSITMRQTLNPDPPTHVFFELGRQTLIWGL